MVRLTAVHVPPRLLCAIPRSGNGPCGASALWLHRCTFGRPCVPSRCERRRAMAVESKGRALVAVLAAGASRRMGAPKLLLPYLDSKGSKTCLLERACAAACASRASGVAVVCGPNVDEVRAVVGRCASGCAGGCEAGRPSVLVNGAWETGQASSVACAARAALEGGFDALVVMTADQPFVEARHLDALMAAHAGAAPEGADGFSTAGPDGRAVHALRASRGGRGGNPCLFPARRAPPAARPGGRRGRASALRVRCACRGPRRVRRARRRAHLLRRRRARGL